jgi:hypothetical protein
MLLQQAWPVFDRSIVSSAASIAYVSWFTDRQQSTRATFRGAGGEENQSAPTTVPHLRRFRQPIALHSTWWNAAE